jgi:phage shock protein C
LKKLTRSKDQKFLGVLGGTSEYFHVDPSLVRLGFILVTVFTGFFPCILGYVLAAMVLPKSEV